MLGIGRATLIQFINEGLIGVIQQGNGRQKISHKELLRFLETESKRDKKSHSITHTNKVEITNLICGKKTKKNNNYDSVELFKGIMEKNIYGKHIQ